MALDDKVNDSTEMSLHYNELFDAFNDLYDKFKLVGKNYKLLKRIILIFLMNLKN